MSDTTQDAEHAEMYRWLRDRGEWFTHTSGKPSPWVVIGTGHWDAAPCSGVNLDAAIRAAMAGSVVKDSLTGAAGVREGGKP